MAEQALPPAGKEQAERLHVFAHDIKNRLTGLWEAMRLLREPATDGMDQQEVLAFAEKSFLSAQRDVEDLLDAFAVDRGVSAERCVFDLDSALEDAIRSEGYRLRKKEQEVHVRGTVGPTICGDLQWTARILQALSPRRSVIDVELGRSDGQAFARVTDAGIGLSEEDLARIFTRYTLLSSRSTEGEPQARGTLARARQWAEAQGGTLTASSPGIGQGSAFTCTWPTT
jgi:signal transduction histidine kinase